MSVYNRMPTKDTKKYNWYVGKMKRQTINVLVSNYPSPLDKWHTIYNKKYTYDSISNIINDFFYNLGFKVRIETPFGLGATVGLAFLARMLKSISTVLEFIDRYYANEFLARRQKIELSIWFPKEASFQDALFTNSALLSKLEDQLPYVDFHINYMFKRGDSVVIIYLDSIHRNDIYERIIRKLDRFDIESQKLTKIVAKKQLFWYRIYFEKD